jgi:hypothetical protein
MNAKQIFAAVALAAVCGTASAGYTTLVMNDNGSIDVNEDKVFMDRKNGVISAVTKTFTQDGNAYVGAVTVECGKTGGIVMMGVPGVIERKMLRWTPAGTEPADVIARHLCAKL